MYLIIIQSYKVPGFFANYIYWNDLRSLLLLNTVTVVIDICNSIEISFVFDVGCISFDFGVSPVTTLCVSLRY
jgi:hypothetical protein